MDNVGAIRRAVEHSLDRLGSSSTEHFKRGAVGPWTVRIESDHTDGFCTVEVSHAKLTECYERVFSMLGGLKGRMKAYDEGSSDAESS